MLLFQMPPIIEVFYIPMFGLIGIAILVAGIAIARLARGKEVVWYVVAVLVLLIAALLLWRFIDSTIVYRGPYQGL